MLSSCSPRALRLSSSWRSRVRISANVNGQGMLRTAAIRHAPLFRGSANIRKYASGSTLSPDDGENAAAKMLREYKEISQIPPATHEIRDLRNAKIGERVVLHGYIGYKHDVSKNFSFVRLVGKDLNQIVQVVSDKLIAGDAHWRFRRESPNSPMAIEGVVKERKSVGEGREFKWRQHETAIEHVEISLINYTALNVFPKTTQFDSDTVFHSHQRHLQLRSEKELRHALKFRARVGAICRDELSNKQDFLEVETPLLFKSTPEGAREFLVPTRAKGLTYALPQSPQQYKQTLMASGIPKYYQIAKCFRDEDLRADRQPEFTQLDLEMSFANAENVMDCIEGLIRRLWSEMLSVTLPVKFPRMSYDETMAKYGSDKPDIRLGMQIARIDHLLPADLISKIGPHAFPAVDVFKLRLEDAPPSKVSRFISNFMKSPKGRPFIENPDGQPGIAVIDPKKPLRGLQVFGFEAAERLEEDLGLEDGDVVIIQARKDEPFSGGSTKMGQLRLALHKAAVAEGYLPQPEGFEFLWINDFPLFSPTNDTDPGQGGAAGLAATHHPFTAPKTSEDIDLLATDPAAARADHYDLVVNGVELGGGSRRIHRAEVQEWIMREVLRMKPERIEDFRHLLEILNAGCPPHAGIALGFDRLIAVMLGKESVRDVIAFPKSGKGEDMLVKSPNKVTKEQLETYHLRLMD